MKTKNNLITLTFNVLINKHFQRIKLYFKTISKLNLNKYNSNPFSLISFIPH